MTAKPDLTALLGSRICHDLISPLGAIGNGLELLAINGSTAGPEMALISESVANASARIRFFRVAYGAAAATARLGRPEIVSILSDTGRGGRLTIDWQVAGDLPRREVKLAFLAIQCLETAMPYGGRLTVTRNSGRWQATGTAPKLKSYPELWGLLTDPAGEAQDELTAGQVQYALLAHELGSQDRRIAVDQRESEIRLLW